MTHLQFNDEIGLTGTLEIRKIEKGAEETLFLEDNLIMDRAKAHLLSLIYDTSGSTETDPIATFRVGNGGVFGTNITAVRRKRFVVKQCTTPRE